MKKTEPFLTQVWKDKIRLKAQAMTNEKLLDSIFGLIPKSSLERKEFLSATLVNELENRLSGWTTNIHRNPSQT